MTTVRAALVLTAIGALAGVAGAEELQKQAISINIASQPLGDALNKLAEQTKLQFVLYSEIGRGIAAPPVIGMLTPEAALGQLLANSGLRFEYLDDGTVAILPKAMSSAVSDRVHLTQAAGAASTQNQGSASPSSEAMGESTGIEEIVVTAQKREERLQDVPVPVSAVPSEVLLNSNQFRLQDYFTRVPGLALVSGGLGGRGGLPQLTIRGLTTGGFANPTVGVVVDDVPIGSPTGSAFGQFTPDLDPSDLQRVEVLRGPQGTLYGASSVGGLVKYVTADPSTVALTGRVQGGISDVKGGKELGYSLRGALNVPITDNVAIRASAYTRNDPGYLQDARTGRDGINEGVNNGGRAALLWRPSDAFSLKLSALFQQIDLDRPADVTGVGLGDLETDATPGLGGFKATLEAYSAILSATAGRADIVSMTGYNVVDTKNRGDFGVFGVALLEHFKTERFTQELRATLPLGERFEWLVGGYYSNARNNPREQDLYPVDPTTGVIGDPFFFDHGPSKFAEYAAFTDLTVKVSDSFDIQIGARRSHINQSAFETQTLSDGTVIEVSPLLTVKADPTTFLLTPRLKLSPVAMVYARFSSGYRPGGPNPNASLLGVPNGYGPDKSYNYEIGFKASTLNRMLSMDASVYYIDWKDLQTNVNVPGTLSAYLDNVGSAKSRGVELSAEGHPWQGMTLSANAAWNDAELSDVPANSAAIVASAGDQLPYSPRFSGNFSAEQEFQVSARWTGFAGFSVSRVGERKDIFGTSADRAIFPEYTKFDLRAGVRGGGWSINAFVNNVSDKRGVLFVNSATGYISYITPRTAGMSLARNF